MTKSIQYGLLGANLGHSFSKLIHEKLTDYSYQLLSLTETELVDFMGRKEFKAVNVTIPYKETVLPFLSVIDDHARAIGAVNTIINDNGCLKGYNTDYYGFEYTLNKHHIDVKGKKVLVLGAGGAGKAVRAVVKDRGASEVIFTSTKGGNGSVTNEIACAHHNDAEIIINTTPVGMFPNIDAQPVALNAFRSCEALIDIIYNPLRTSLMLEAHELGIKTAGGLEMLVMQAKKAVEYFTGQLIEDALAEDVFTSIKDEKSNITLIGMPSCGKTSIGQLLAEKTGKKFIDTDEIIVKEAKKSIKDIFDQDGEAKFRQMEHSAIKQIASIEGCIISTGGGVIKDKNNIDNLKHNSTVVFIDMPLEKLVMEDPERPLSTSAEAVTALYSERYPLYTKYADIHADNSGTMEDTVNTILTRYYRSL